MRPRKLDEDSERCLVIAFNKVKSEMKAVKRCNQYQIAVHLKSYFQYRGDWERLERVDKKLEQLLLERKLIEDSEQMASDYLGINARSICYYVYHSSPEAIVQKVKRIVSGT